MKKKPKKKLYYFSVNTFDDGSIKVGLKSDSDYLYYSYSEWHEYIFWFPSFRTKARIDRIKRKLVMRFQRKIDLENRNEMLKKKEERYSAEDLCRIR